MTHGDKLFQHLSDNWREEHLRALAYTFALIAAADRNIAFAETRRFFDVARDKLELKFLPFGHLTSHFDEAVAEIMGDTDKGWRNALDAIRLAVEHGMTVEDVISAARVAVIADLKIESVEEDALKRLAEELGVSPDTV